MTADDKKTASVLGKAGLPGNQGTGRQAATCPEPSTRLWAGFRPAGPCEKPDETAPLRPAGCLGRGGPARAPITRRCPPARVHTHAPRLWFPGRSPLFPPIPGGLRASVLAEGDPDPVVRSRSLTPSSRAAAAWPVAVFQSATRASGERREPNPGGGDPTERSGTALSCAQAPCSVERPVRLDKDTELAGPLHVTTPEISTDK